MIGSVFIHTQRPADLSRLAEDMEAIDDFVHLSLDSMLTLDFEEVCVAHDVAWSLSEPVVFDEEAGLAIAGVEPSGLAWVLSNKNLFTEDQQSDLDKLQAFVEANGAQSLYEVSVF
jgi:hypothetical protein